MQGIRPVRGDARSRPGQELCRVGRTPQGHELEGCIYGGFQLRLPARALAAVSYTHLEISDALGKETIDSFNTSENRGSQTSHGLNYQKLGKALMSEDEIAIMDGGKCILQLRGVRPDVYKRQSLPL